MYDVVIIGGGPAGATLARLLPKNLKVLLIDKRNLGETNNYKKEKACGGLISPDAQKMLAYFDLGVPKAVLQDPQLFSVRVIDQDNDLSAFYQRNYINIDREKFDRWLYSLIPNRVEKRECTVKSILFENGLYSVVTSDGVFKAKYLVGADGGNSVVRKNLYPTSRIKKYTSIQRWYKQDTEINHYVALFDRKLTDYYSWTISKNGYLIVGSAFEKAKVKEKFDLLEQMLQAKGYDLSKPVKEEGAFILRPSKLSHIILGKDNHFLIGEAAGLISPSSAEGYSYAFRSAKYLAESFTKSNIIRTYKKKSRKLKLNLIYKWMKYPFMYNHFIRRIIIKSRIMTIK